jgi:phosphoribosyl 1,2-cyclic phosphodiesterase
MDHIATPLADNRPAELTVTLWGVRGSLPAPSSATFAFGGDTICIEVQRGGDSLIIDAGTGLRALSATRGRGGGEHHLVFTHWHLDHLLGLLSYPPFYDPAARITLHAPILDGHDPAFIFDQIFGPPFHPVRIWNAGADVRIRNFIPGDGFNVGLFDVATVSLNHPGGACGYRIGCDDVSVAVLIDHEHPPGPPDERLTAFCKGADLLLYDAHYDEALDYALHRGWGHSTWQAGEALRAAADVPELRCIHHSPAASDEILLARERALVTLHEGSRFGRAVERLTLGGVTPGGRRDDIDADRMHPG